MEVIESRSEQFNLNATREENSLFYFHMALLILKSQMDPACVCFAVVCLAE